MNKEKTTRRHFIRTAGACVFCASKAGVLLTATEKVMAVDTALTNNNEIVINQSAVTEIKESVLIEMPESDFPISLMKLEDEQYIALSMKCPHQGGTTEWLKRKDQFVCPTHGARFTETGEVIRGPTTKNMVSYPVRVEGDKIYIQL